MGNLARNLQQDNKYEQLKKGQVVKTKKEKRFLITPGERVLGLLFGALLCFGGVQMVSAQASLYEVNKEIQSINSSIEEQQKENNDLMMQVSELSTYERIWEKARELGLKLNENNVKVVQNP